MKSLVFFFLFLVLRCYTQNLVPNPSFEILTNPTFAGGDIYLGHVPPWDSPTNGNSDALSTIEPTYAVPNCFTGYQQTHSGNSFVGSGLYGINGSSYREYIQVQLDSTLVSGQKYCASFYVSLANSFEIACNNFGMYFSTSHTYVPTTDTLGFTPQINDTTIVSDTVGWKLIYGQYTAHGGEKYIIIGNFYSNANTDTTYIQGSHLGDAYYYIDDVNVHCCTCDSVNTGVGELGIRNEELEIYPNPVGNELGIRNYELGIREVNLYNVIGEMVLKKEIKNKEIEIDVGDLPKGMYFLQVKNENGIVNKKIIKE